jgi:hypothetical protein
MADRKESGMTKPKRRRDYDSKAVISFIIDLEEIEAYYKDGKKKNLPFIRPKMKKQKGREREEEKH